MNDFLSRPFGFLVYILGCIAVGCILGTALGLGLSRLLSYLGV